MSVSLGMKKSNSIISIYNEIKDTIPEISIKNENELLNEEIMEIYKYYLNIIGNNYNKCETCGKITIFFVKIVL